MIDKRALAVRCRASLCAAVLLAVSVGVSGAASAEGAPDRPLSRAEVQGIHDTLQACWNAPTGSDKLPPIEVRVFVDPKGVITGAELVDRDIVSRSPQHKTAAMSALRSMANPRCRQLPATVGDIGHMVIVFDPKDVQ